MRSIFSVLKNSPILEPNRILIPIIVPIPARAPMRTKMGELYRAVNAIMTNCVLSPNSANIENKNELANTFPFFSSISTFSFPWEKRVQIPKDKKIIEAPIFTYVRGMNWKTMVPKATARMVISAIPEKIPKKTLLLSYFEASEIVIN